MRNKHSASLLCLLLLSLAIPRGTALAEDELGTVNVELTGLAGATGNVYIAVYDSEDSWLGEDTVMEQKADIAGSLDGDILRAALRLPPGQYALSIFYDANGNGELDTNWIGIPNEPVAISNNARPSFGPPSYEDAVFTLGAEPVVQRISIEAI